MSTEHDAPATPARRPSARARAVAAPASTPAGRALAVLAAVLLACAALLVAAPHASAHNALLGTDPADGSSLATPPTHITLTFDQPAQALGTEIVVLGPDGAAVSTGTPELVDNTVAQALAADLPAGAYTVQWRVTSADGHPLSGELAFTATAGAPVATAPVTPEPIEPTAEPTMTTQAVEPSPEATVSGSEELAEDEDAGLAAGAVAAVIVAVLAAGAIAWFVVRERRRSKDGRTED
jgi:methionine-rich copper-binding protein CopC